MKRFVPYIVLILIFCAGCLWAGGSKEETDGITLVDARGKDVTLSALPQRVVVAGRGAIPLVDAAYLFPEASERLFSMVRCDQGKGSFAAVLDDDFLGESIFDHTIGPEDVVAQNPDCVLMKSYMFESLGQPLETLGIPVVCLDLESPDQFDRDVRILGTLFGNGERAEEVLAWYDREAGQVAAALAGRDTGNDPTVLFIYHSTKGGNIAFNVPPAAWLQTELVTAAGGVPVWIDDMTGKGWMKVGIEQIAQWDPDIIFLTDYFNPVEEVKEDVLADAAWKELRAVKEGRLYAFPTDFYSWDQPDARWILALKWMAATLHPDTAPAFTTEADITEFFTTLYGMTPEAVEEHIITRLTGDTDL